MAKLFNISKTPFARERLAISTASVALTAATFKDTASSPSRVTRGALVSVLTAPIYYSILGGSTPTNDATSAGIGIPAAIGSQILLETLEQVVNFKAIRSGAVDAVIEVVYFR